MNKINRKIFGSLLIVPLMYFSAVSCDSTENEPDYSYTIENVWWSDSIDGNNDGFVHFKRLNFNVHIAEDVSRRISPRVYYKIHDATSYSFYAFADDYQAKGNNADNNIFVSIGPPNKELQRGYYDFAIEIYEANKDRLETKTDTTFADVLMNNPFEDPATDKIYSIAAWWTNSYDRNGNGYWRHAELNLDIDTEEGVTKSLNAKLLYRDAEAEAEDYTLYETFNDLTINGATRDDSVTYIVGLPNEELMFGKYDFRINVYESGSDLLAAFLDQEDDNLNDVKFETEDDDLYLYSVEKAWWTEEIDNDGDGFTSQRLLNFDVDVDKDETRKIYAKIYYRDPDTTDYSIYDSTDNFEIKGVDTTDFYKWYVSNLDSNKYDFLITILESEPYDTLKNVEAARSALVDTLLEDQNFEAYTQDTFSNPTARIKGRLKK